MATPTRPVLRYHGGKWKLAPWIISHFPPHRVYVEPYGGAASVLLRKRRSYAEVYNDWDFEVVNVFRVLRDPKQAAELERLVRLTPFSRDEFELANYRYPFLTPVEQARKTLFRSFAGHSATGTSGRATGFRCNVTRSRTIPAHDWATWPDEIRFFVERLRGVIIESESALDVIRRYDRPDTLFYVDPPYPASTRSGGSYRFEMTDDDHRELAQVLRSVQGMVVVSGYPCPLYDEQLYPDWVRVTRQTRADGAGPRTECLWLSPSVSERRRQTSLFQMEVV